MKHLGGEQLLNSAVDIRSHQQHGVLKSKGDMSASLIANNTAKTLALHLLLFSFSPSF